MSENGEIIRGKQESPLAAIEESGLGYDPTTQHLDLSREEKRRTTALMMAIQAYNNLIIKDAEMYEAVCRENRNGDKKAPMIEKATIDAMVQAAIKFDFFISGALTSATDSANPHALGATESASQES